MARGNLAAALIALPAVLTLGALAAGHALEPAVPAPATFADALVRGASVEQVYAFIHAGADANQPIRVADGDLPSLEAGAFPPLVIAVATGHSNTVRMLIDYADPDAAALHHAHCLARQLGDATSAAAIARRSPTAADCASPR